MKSFSPSEKLLIEEIMQAAKKTRVAVRGLAEKTVISRVGDLRYRKSPP